MCKSERENNLSQRCTAFLCDPRKAVQRAGKVVVEASPWPMFIMLVRWGFFFFATIFLSGIFPANLGMNVWLTMQIWRGVCFNFHINNEK